METEKEWLETILERDWADSRVARVTDVKTESVVSKGDNYASDLTRIRMEVILGSGNRATRSLILKSLPDTELKAKTINQWGVFKKETKIYKELLPTMEDLMLEIGDRSTPLWGKCVAYTPYTRLVLQDLQECGYNMADKRKGLDFNHAKLVMESLGKWHALSVTLKERGMIDPNEYVSFFMNGEEDKMQFFHDNSIVTLAEVIETTWEPEYKPYADKLRALKGKTFKKLMGIFKRDDSKFNVLNHGDCWVNNMMFKYNADSGLPTGMKFIDFQMSVFATPALDLQYFVSSSVPGEVREAHLKELLGAYRDSLGRWLGRLGAEAAAPTREEVEAWFEESAFFGLIMGITGICFMLVDPDDTPDIEKLIKDAEENKMTLNYRPYLSKAYTERAKYIFKYSIKKGVL